MGQQQTSIQCQASTPNPDSSLTAVTVMISLEIVKARVAESLKFVKEGVSYALGSIIQGSKST